MGFPGGSDDKESACNAGDLDSRLGRSPGEGNGYPLHCSCLDSSMDRGAWWAAVHYWETNTFTCTHTHTHTHTHTQGALHIAEMCMCVCTLYIKVSYIWVLFI